MSKPNVSQIQMSKLNVSQIQMPKLKCQINANLSAGLLGGKIK